MAKNLHVSFGAILRHLAKIEQDPAPSLGLSEEGANRAGIEDEAKYDPTGDDQR